MDGFAKLPGPDPEAVALKQELSKIILWNEHNAPRSKQRSVGPSELGDPCDRKLAYRLADVPRVNLGSDPWPAIVGTSIHNWLERAVNKYQADVENLGYTTEVKLYADPLVRGHSDLFKGTMVLDWKTAGTDVMRKVRKGDIPEHYKTQLMVYGLGHVRAGRAVDKVALIFLPRSGWLRDAEIWIGSYDEKVALAAINRMYRIADQAIALDVEKNPQRLQLIDASPGDSCVWCPWYSVEKAADVAADEKGCPGR